MSIIDDNLPTGLMPMTQQEEKELRRVFEYLVDYESKKSIKKNITDQQKSIHAPVPILTENISSNDKALVEFNTTTEKKISADSIFEILRELGQKTSRKAVEEMIWECDEDLDECLNWHEFKLMFSRNITDHTGLEPSRMFNLAQFLIYDKNYNGFVSVDETMNMLYARYGRAKMELKLKELFGDKMPEIGRIGGGEIDFTAYLQAVERIQMQTFLGTTKGRMIASKLSHKKTNKLPVINN